MKRSQLRGMTMKAKTRMRMTKKIRVKMTKKMTENHRRRRGKLRMLINLKISTRP